jgi:tRNA (guanine37-N1)-methyltransferase
MAGYDILGNLAILKFPDGTSGKEKKKEAFRILKSQKHIETVLEKSDKVRGRLRTIRTKYLAGKKTKEALYRENNCLFKFDVEKCYFSPRLSGERLEIARKCKKNDNVLVLFAGIGPFSIVIAKLAKSQVTGVELGRECSKYALGNVKLNKLSNVKVIQGDVKKLGKLIRKEKFDKIIMPRPQLNDTFLEYIWNFAGKGTEIYYYDFGKDIGEIVKKVELDIKRSGKKVKIIGFKKAGDIAPYKYRWRVDLKIL